MDNNDLARNVNSILFHELKFEFKNEMASGNWTLQMVLELFKQYIIVPKWLNRVFVMTIHVLIPVQWLYHIN